MFTWFKMSDLPNPGLQHTVAEIIIHFKTTDAVSHSQFRRETKRCQLYLPFSTPASPLSPCLTEAQTCRVLAPVKTNGVWPAWLQNDKAALYESKGLELIPSMGSW